MATATPAPPVEPPAPRRDWLDATLRLATSWVGLFTAYAAAVILVLAKYKELNQGLQELGIPRWAGIALIAAFPVLALVFSTIPAFLEQRRIKRYSEITGALETGYFTLRPRETEADFDRADNAHQKILQWMENTQEPVLYLTGASGTGKSSLLSAWVIPKLKREKHVVIQLRGYEEDLLARIKTKLLEPGVVWDKPPAKSEDLRALLDRATQRLAQNNVRRLFLVVDQFEEFLILTDPDHQQPFQQFLSQPPIPGLTVLLVYRPEYESLLENQPWPRLQLDTNRRVISAFTENAANDFMRKSGITVNPALLRDVLREAAEIEQTTGLIRPVTINLCGLVLGRFSTGLPRLFRSGIIRGFLKESLQLPEVRDAAGKLIPHLITGNVTKRPRTVADLAEATLLPPSSVRACLRRLGEPDRAIVRPLDRQQETWEISHDFLVPLLDSIVARRTTTLWRRARPWLPWTATALIAIAAIAIPLTTRPDPRAALIAQGWTVSKEGGVLDVLRKSPIPPASISILRSLPSPLSLELSSSDVTDVSALRELKSLTYLDLHGTKVTDISALRDLKNLMQLDLSVTNVTDVSPLRELTNLTRLDLSYTSVTDVSPLRELKNLTNLDLNFAKPTDVSPLRELTNLTQLNLSSTKVTDVSPLRELKKLTYLSLRGTNVTDVSPLRDLKNLTDLDLGFTGVTDVSPLQELKNLTELDLTNTNVKDVSALRELKNLTKLDLIDTKVTDVSPLRELKNLKIKGP